ncbi:MAG: transposase [Thermoleophilaceae bacterium]
MLTLLAGQAESLWDEALPVEVKELPEDLAALDGLLADAELLAPIVERWRWEFEQTGRLVVGEGRPTIAMETYVRLMVLKQRFRWGYRTLVAEVSDSIHLRRFCRISLSERVPDESTVRKLTRRIGPETVAELTRALIVKATREKRFRARAVRIDSTVIEADVKYPTDAGLASAGVKSLAREGRKLAQRIGEKRRRVRDRSRSMGRKLRAISRTIRRRSGEAESEVLKLTAETGELLERSIKEARRLAAIAKRQARGRGAQAKLKAAGKLEQFADRCEKVARQIKQRVRGEAIKDRIVSLSDPDARPIRKGKLGKPNEFGFVSQLAEVTENTKRGARGLIVPASTALGNPGEHTLLPGTVAELTRLGIRPREVALDGGFMPGPTNEALDDLAPDRVFIAGRQQPGSKRTIRRLRRYRTG